MADVKKLNDIETLKLRVSGTVNDSIVDGPGFRFVVFMQGCEKRCKGCHNPSTWDKNGGYEITFAEIMESIKGNPLLDGVTFSGGEPFLQAPAVSDLARLIKETTSLNIISYSGYTFEYLLENATPENAYLELLKTIDILVDGEFVLEEKSFDLSFRGSKNQRSIDVKRSLSEGKVIISENQ
jgi:anaerobic ribonucleoside-triphosphate reductase activating protein